MTRRSPRTAARYDYFIEETMEAGLMLTGTEVMSLRVGRPISPVLRLGQGGRSS
jgi:hypothetical protein